MTTMDNLNGERRRQGRIEVICGSMFSGKTEELIRRMKRAEFARQKVEIFKPSIDTRYSDEDVVSHDQNAIQVLVNNIFVGYIPASIAAQISTYIANPNYRYDAILTGRGGPYKTLNIETERVISRESELTYYLDLTVWHLAEK